MIKKDFRDACIWNKKGYCKISFCDRGKFFSQHKKDYVKCDMYLLPYDKADIDKRLVLEKANILRLIKGGVRKNWRKIGDKQLGVRLLELILKKEFKLKKDYNLKKEFKK